MKTSSFGWMLLTVTALLLVSTTPAIAQDHGSGGSGGGGGCGDTFGDLIHILRHDVTGQPILQKRWVEMPAAEPGYGWGYCVIAVNESGEELGFEPLSCDVAEADLPRVVEVNYFGRLNGGRTKERNNRMHFNEVLSTIKTAELVKEGPAGRLMMGFDCSYDEKKEEFKNPCAEWATVDSPMESLGLYSRLMKYGHFQTDPREVDEWHHGDPKLSVQYQPALGPEDYAKFHKSVQHLLPESYDPKHPDTAWECFVDVNFNDIWDPTEPYTDIGTEDVPANNEYDLGEPFTDINFNGFRDDGGDTFAFNPACMEQEYLDDRDFTRAASFAGAAASKTGKSTRDLTSYLNRIMKITKNTPFTKRTLAWLPALVRECKIQDGWTAEPDGEDQVEPSYTEDCEVKQASDSIENYEFFPKVQELFVDFYAAEYYRSDWRSEGLELIVPAGDDNWVETNNVPLTDWLRYANGPAGQTSEVEIDAFVGAMGDTIRTIQLIHNYEIPEPLWDFTYQ